MSLSDTCCQLKKEHVLWEQAEAEVRRSDTAVSRKTWLFFGSGEALSILGMIIFMQKPICSHFLALLCMVTLQNYEKMIYAWHTRGLAMSHSQDAQVHLMECSTLHQLLFEFTALVENSSAALHSKKQSTELTKLPKLTGSTATHLRWLVLAQWGMTWSALWGPGSPQESASVKVSKCSVSTA